MHTMPLPRLHRSFRTLGVRHIFVTDTRNEVMGVITRKDLLPEVLEANLSVSSRHSISQRFSVRASIAGDCDVGAPPDASPLPLSPRRRKSRKKSVHTILTGAAGGSWSAPNTVVKSELV